MNSVFRSSEFWVSVIVLVGFVGGQTGWWNATDFDSIIKPALTYVAARIVSKVAKTVTFSPPAPPPPPAPAK